MNRIHEIVVDQLNIGEVRKILPSDYQHLHVDNAKAGSQSSKTFIVGVFQSAFKKFVIDSIPKKRLTLREVLDDGKEGDLLDVLTYKEYANAIDDFLNISKDVQNLWIIFSSVKFSRYQGYNQDGWCSLTLRVGQKQSCEAQMWLVIQDHPVTAAVSPLREKKICKQTELVSASEVAAVSRKKSTTINGCFPSKKATIFAVVSQIVKPPQMTHKGTHHMLLALVDPSCYVPGAQREDLLLHVFLNDTAKPHLPEGVEMGDILLLREITIENFSDKVHGKVYNNKQVVKFSSDITAPIKPVTEKDDYILTDIDRKEVITLRHWWESVSSQPQEPPVPGSLHGTEHRALHTISDINQEITFSLFCQVMETRLIQVMNQNMIIYRVQDGTRTAINFSEYDLHDAELKLLTQSETCIPMGSLVVDIIVMSPGEEALNIKDKSFVYLSNVQCLENSSISSGDFPSQVFDLLIYNNINKITSLPPSHIEAQKIIRRLTEKKDTRDSNDYLGELGREPNTIDYAVSPMRPSPKPSPNRIHSQPLNPQRIYHPGSGASQSARHHITISRNISTPDKTQNPTYTSNNHYPHVKNQANGDAHASSKVNLISDLPSNDHCSHPDISAKGDEAERNSSPDSQNTEPYIGITENISFPSLSPESQEKEDMNQHNKNNQCHQSITKVKRKLPMNFDCDVSPLGNTSKKIKSDHLKICYSDCIRDGRCSVLNGDFTDSTFKKVFDDCNADVVYRVSAVIKDLYFLSSSPCEKCTDDKVCIHNWVWGLCNSCEKCYTDWKLRECFSYSNLKSSQVLPCITCSSSFKDQPSESTSHAVEDISRIAHVSGTVKPVIRLKVLLADPQSGFESIVNLSGDHAKNFIGQEPKFSWLVEDVEENLANLIKNILDSEMLLSFGIQKSETSSGIAQFDICNTTLKCMDEQK